MSKPNTSFPQDEFDPRPGAVTRNGVHRAGRSAWSQVWPFLVVLLVAAALGLGIIQKLMQSPDSVVNDIISEATSSSPAAEEDGSEEDGASDSSKDDAGSEDNGVVDEDAANSDDTSDDSSAEPAEDDAASTEPEDTETDDSATVSKSSSVRVLNASGKQGIAGVAAEKLTSDGFTSVEATNFEGEKPSASVIYYKGAENKATAEHVGSLLGISNLSDVESLRADVSVVLR